jgi:hypothetical protein
LSEGIPVVDVDFRSALERLVLAVSQRGPAGGAVPQRRRRG